MFELICYCMAYIFNEHILFSHNTAMFIFSLVKMATLPRNGTILPQKHGSWEQSFDLQYMPWVTFDLFYCINIDGSLHINNFV